MESQSQNPEFRNNSENFHPRYCVVSLSKRLSSALYRFNPRNVMARLNKVIHLRITAYKGIGKHSYSLSPAMNFDNSAVSLRLHGKVSFNYVDKITKMYSTTSTFLYMFLSKTCN